MSNKALIASLVVLSVLIALTLYSGIIYNQRIQACINPETNTWQYSDVNPDTPMWYGLFGGFAIAAFAWSIITIIIVMTHSLDKESQGANKDE